MTATTERAVPTSSPPRTPNPRFDQYRRTWYFFRRNRLALVGLGILSALIAVAIVAAFLPLPWNSLSIYCGTEQQTPNTYNSTTSATPSYLTAPNAPNGTYSYTVGRISGYTTNWSGKVTVDGSNPTVEVVFTPIVYPVTFTETGLPAGSNWSASLSGLYANYSTTDSMVVYAPNGSYLFTIGTTADYTPTPSQGYVNVTGHAESEAITFAAGALRGPGLPLAPPAEPSTAPPAEEYSITFHESGLSPASLQRGWQITINTVTPPDTICPGTVICTYPSTSLSPGSGCYQYPVQFTGVIPPTLRLSPVGLGPLPLGSLDAGPPYGIGPSTPHFYNLADALLRGSDWSLFIAFTVVGLGALAGLLLGAAAGFYGGVAEESAMRLVDIFLSIPQLLFVVIVLTVFTQDGFLSSNGLLGVLALVGALVAIWWPFYARVVRGQVLVVREQKYIEAARASGAPSRKILVRHIIPNSVYPVFIQMSLDVGQIPLLLGALVFLGFRIFPTGAAVFPEWGGITANSVNAIQIFLNACTAGNCYFAWWQYLFPGLALFLFAISVNLLADGLRDALDPRLRR